MDDLTIELVMALVVLGIVLRTCWHGNHRPCFWTVIGASVMSIGAAIRHLEMSDIVVPAVVAVLTAIIGWFAHTARPRKEVGQAD
ncbi:MAG TPA: hypothetical protein VMF58_13115 [Rhizomicrobium sp.]|nr:hypothetical protein [Rhizomicrobium sp.]